MAANKSPGHDRALTFVLALTKVRWAQEPCAGVEEWGGPLSKVATAATTVPDA